MFPSFPYIEKMLDMKRVKEDQYDTRTCGTICHTTSLDCLSPDFDLPMAPYIISEPIKTWGQAHAFIAENIDSFGFVKTCYLSPKDWLDPPVFKNADDALTALMHSPRTTDCVTENQHIVMKQVRQYETQARCYIIADELQLVIGNMSQTLVMDFMDTHIFNIPFHYCCIELGSFDSGSCGTTEVIEINTINENLGVEPFEWEDIWHVVFDDPKTTTWCNPEGPTDSANSSGFPQFIRTAMSC